MESTTYKYVGSEPAQFNTGDGKEHYLATGKRAKLPADDAYVKGLVASGQLVEMPASDTKDADNVTNTGTTDSAETAPAGKSASRAR